MIGMPFAGFGPAAFAWLEGIERDNSRAYFSEHREVYEDEVRAPLDALLEELAAEFGGTPRLFRQQRDIRFSADKSPYKTRTYGVLEGTPAAVTGFYAELSSAGLYAGTGYHVLARDQLARFREAAAEPHGGKALEAAVAAAEGAGLELAGERLKTAPRGVAADHPRIELLRWKSLIAGRRLAPRASGGIGRAAALEHVAGAWRAAAPLTAWLDARVGASELPAESRLARR